ncbi:MAG TPA: FUSC family protein [Ilumatobacteraceae bacterium]|nr:FUSC family protein [Ilumatobacteraceae bacterium]
MNTPFVERLRRRVSHLPWTPPTSTEIGVVVKSALAAGVSWWIAGLVTGVGSPVLASLTAIVVVQVSVRASVRSAIERSVAVVLGVIAALAISHWLHLNAITVTLLVAASLGVAELGLRLPRAAARQVPVSMLVVLAAVSSSSERQGWHRAVDTILGAAVGAAISLVLPASRLVDARQTLDRLADSVAKVLETMGAGLQDTWSVEQTETWRKQARVTRGRLVDQAIEAVGNGKEAARWNVRDRRHIDELTRFEEALPRFERTAIGVSVISRGLDDHARISGTTHKSMAAMGQLLIALATAVRATVANVLDPSNDGGLDASLEEVRTRRDICKQAASRRARIAIDHDEDDDLALAEGEWLNYAAMLVQVERMVADLSAPLPT